MEEQMKSYEEKKGFVRMKKARTKGNFDVDEFENGQMEQNGRKVELSDVIQVGSKIIIGGGVGLLAGVATIAVAASAAEVVLVGAVTKIAGVVGGALGLSFGINSYNKVKKKKSH